MSEKCIVCEKSEKSVLKSSIPKMSLHVFPVSPKQRQIWLKRCGLTDKEVLPNRKICSFHFEPTCFIPSTKRRILYRDAEPTIFKKGHAKTTNMPLKNVKVITGKSSQMTEKCIVCEKPVLNSSMSLHVFPACPKKRQIWLKRCGLTNEEVLPKHKICSFHFEPSCFRSNPIRRILYRDAEPTIFKKGHAKTNMPLKIVKGKPTNWNKNVIAVQNRQSRDISPSKAVNKEFSGQNRESRGIPSTRYAKRVLAGAAKKVIASQNRQSRYISPTKAAKELIAGQNCQSLDILPTKTGKKVIASQKRRAHDMSPTKANKKRISGQNHESYDILPTKTSKKVIAGQSSQSHISLTKTGKKVIARQNHQARDMSSTKVAKEVIVRQSGIDFDNLPEGVFEQFVFEQTTNLLAFQRKRIELVNKKLETLTNLKSSLLSQLEIAGKKIAELSKKSTLRQNPINNSNQ